MMFDFGDVFAGPITRAKTGDDYERSHPGGHFESNYNLLYDLASRYNDGEIQGVADWMKSMGHTGQEEWWTLVWRNPELKAKSINELNHGTISRITMLSFGAVVGTLRQLQLPSNAAHPKATARRT